MKVIINITKREAKIIREKLPKTHIAATKNKRYMEESKLAMTLLEKLRSSPIQR